MKHSLLLLSLFISVPDSPGFAQWLNIETANGVSVSSSPFAVSVASPYIKGTYIRKNYFPVRNYVVYPYVESPVIYSSVWDDYDVVDMVVPRVRKIRIPTAESLIPDLVFGIPIFRETNHHHRMHIKSPAPKHHKVKVKAPKNHRGPAYDKRSRVKHASKSFVGNVRHHIKGKHKSKHDSHRNQPRRNHSHHGGHHGNRHH